MALLAGSWLLLVFLEGRTLLVFPFAPHTSISFFPYNVMLFEACLSQTSALLVVLVLSGVGVAVSSRASTP